MRDGGSKTNKTVGLFLFQQKRQIEFFILTRAAKTSPSIQPAGPAGRAARAGWQTFIPTPTELEAQ